MGGAHLRWKLGFEILDYYAEETLIGIYLCRRYELEQLFGNKNLLQQTCYMDVLFLDNIFLFWTKFIHSDYLLVSIRDFDSDLIIGLLFLVLDFSVVHTTGIYMGLQLHISQATYTIVGG